MDESSGFAAFLGVLFGILLVVAVVFVGLNMGAAKIQTASLPVSPPLIFIPK
ncbi:MAG: hypothetical protein QOJ96_1455 [Alphaproteobacteria bacterium]|jgi:hypothetical protein|nr:hypothetical protein [Alphaproteobacteria bacterium]